MAKFNLGHKLAEFTNKLLGVNISVNADNGEEKDDVTLFDDIKGAIQTYVDSIQPQLTDLQQRASAHDEMKLQVDKLTNDLAAANETIEAHETSVANLEKKFDTRISNLREEIRKELAKEGKVLSDVEKGEDGVPELEKTPKQKGKKEYKLSDPLWNTGKKVDASIG